MEPTNKFDQQIIQLRKDGLTQIEVSEKLGIGRSRVERICKEFDIHISPYAELTDEVINKVLQLREQKIRQNEIAKQTGISRSSVQKIFKNNDVKSIPIEHWKITKEIEIQIIELRNKNMTQRQIAKELNIGRDSVRKVYKRLEINGLPNGKITAKIWEQILQMKESGMIIPDIAKEIGINRASIQAQFNKRGISISKFHITPEIEKVILQLREEGNGTRNIAKILGCARNTVKLWLNDRGIKNEAPPPKPKEEITHKICNNCLEYKDIKYFAIYNRKLTNGELTWSYKSNCKRCYKLRKAVSGAIHAYLKTNGNSIYNLSAMEHLPYTIRDLKTYLESLFEPWMTWENYGKYDKIIWIDGDASTHKWNIDHIIPHSTFKYTNMECQEFLDCWALSNLRPYSAKLNQRDGATRVRHPKN